MAPIKFTTAPVQAQKNGSKKSKGSNALSVPNSGSGKHAELTKTAKPTKELEKSLESRIWDAVEPDIIGPNTIEYKIGQSGSAARTEQRQLRLAAAPYSQPRRIAYERS